MCLAKYRDILFMWKSGSVDVQSLDDFWISFAYHSGKIENNEITWAMTRELFETGRVTGYTGSPRAIFEQQNQKLCYEALKEKIAAKEPLSIELVREIHRILTAGTYDERRYIVNQERPGEFKKHDYVTGIHEVGSAADEVEDELRALLEELHTDGKIDPLKAGAYLHARFEYIHPFADGNGRVGRTLLNYWLMLNGHPPLVIYEENRRRYYDALQRYDEAEELEPLFTFLREQTVKTWAKAWALKNQTPCPRKGLDELRSTGLFSLLSRPVCGKM